MRLKAQGIVLRDYKLDEDRVVTILTREQGVLSAYANGANRLRSALASSTELLCYGQFELFKNRDRYVVDHADAQRTFFGIRQDVEKLSLASYFAQLSTELTPREEPADMYLSLLLNTLHFVENEKRDPQLLKALYELRILTLSGYMPALVACRRCGVYQAEEFFFFPADGTLLCGGCAGGQRPVGGIPLRMGVLAAMRHIIYCPPEKLFAFSLSGEGLGKLERLAEQYLHYQVEKTFHALEIYRALRPMTE